jgi:hypothetical protein
LHDSEAVVLHQTNSRLHHNLNGESPSRGYSGSEEIVEELRRALRNLKSKIRMVRSGCLDVCAFGPGMMIWPEGLWHMKVSKPTFRKLSISI